MTYYKVKESADNKRKYRNDPVDIYVQNELYTTKEVEKFKLNLNYMDKVEVSKQKIYWFFGCRFALEEDIIYQ